MEKLPLFKLTIKEDEEAIQEVNAVALVDVPAIGQPFFSFNKHQFVEPSKGEREEEYIPHCIAYEVGENKDQDQAAAICYDKWKSKFAGEKVSLDYDGVLSTDKGKELAKRLISEGYNVYIISARQDVEGMLSVANSLGIAKDKVYATGSNKAKIEKIKELGIKIHYDNNYDVLDSLPDSITGRQFISHYFSVVNEDEKVVIGPAMIPDLPIYRADETGEYYVFFDKKTIETIALKFYAKGFQQNANEMHAKSVDGITFFQSWIADESKGIPKMKQFEDLPDGTWFLGAKIENDETWAKVKDGTFKGFSVEGMFDMTEIKMRKSADDIIAKLREMLADI